MGSKTLLAPKFPAQRDLLSDGEVAAARVDLDLLIVRKRDYRRIAGDASNRSGDEGAIHMTLAPAARVAGRINAAVRGRALAVRGRDHRIRVIIAD